ncbi:hypothetical protein [Niabella hibiscisoli]|uniref:hypothetical protein n=1 Tax=Niabella hibiscisoli TaxID=1825928 RepID=UPI001F114477|nr:hypothetical protein [Niabella hibiscisoli]MCH5715184.1 hypothetical protein [Niabella hibiscisoli]
MKKLFLFCILTMVLAIGCNKDTSVDEVQNADEYIHERIEILKAKGYKEDFEIRVQGFQFFKLKDTLVVFNHNLPLNTSLVRSISSMDCEYELHANECIMSGVMAPSEIIEDYGGVGNDDIAINLARINQIPYEVLCPGGTKYYGTPTSSFIWIGPMEGVMTVKFQASNSPSERSALNQAAQDCPDGSFFKIQ